MNISEWRTNIHRFFTNMSMGSVRVDVVILPKPSIQALKRNKYQHHNILVYWLNLPFEAIKFVNLKSSTVLPFCTFSISKLQQTKLLHIVRCQRAI